MKRPESILSSHYNSGVVRRASSFVSFLFSLARNCPKQRNGKREQDKIAALFLNS